MASHDYQVDIGKIGELECDFIGGDKDNYVYIQVAYILHVGNLDKIKEREYRAFKKIAAGYPRYIISLDRCRDQQEGVYHINGIDLFLG